MTKITVSVVEDNSSYSNMLQCVMNLSPGIEFYSAYSSAEKALADDGLHSNQPAILLLDLQLGGMSGFEALPLLKKRLPNTEIIILTNNDNYQMVLEGIQLGIAGYMVKGTAIDDIIRVIRDVVEGGFVIDSKLSKYVLEALSSLNQKKDHGPLSKREVEVLELLSLGYAKKQIAQELGLSYSAIALYTANIFKKLKAPNVAAAVAMAIRKNII